MSDSEFDNQSLSSNITQFTARSNRRFSPPITNETEVKEDEESLSYDLDSQQDETEETIPPEPIKIIDEETNISLDDEKAIQELIYSEKQEDPTIEQDKTEPVLISESIEEKVLEEQEKEPIQVTEEATIKEKEEIKQNEEHDKENQNKQSDEINEDSKKQDSKEQVVIAIEEKPDDLLKMPLDQEEPLKENLEDSMLSEKWKDESLKSILKTKKRILVLQNYWGLLIQSESIQLSMSDICFKFTNSIYNAKRNSISLRFTEPKALITLFENGDLFISGCKNRQALNDSTKLIIDALEQYLSITTMKYREPMCLNIIGLMALDLLKVDSTLLNPQKTLLNFSSLKARLNSIKVKDTDETTNQQVEFSLFSFYYEKPNKVIAFSFNVLEENNSFVKFGVLLISSSGYVSMYLQYPNYRICFSDTVEQVYTFVANRLLNALENTEEIALQKCLESNNEKEPVKTFNLDNQAQLVSI